MTDVSLERSDSEAMAQHVLTVSVKDQGTPSKRNFARLIIDVTDHNDHAPEFLTELLQVRRRPILPSFTQCYLVLPSLSLIPS